jgi:regulator of sirC expression with transglutaminase-like and TPR domain
MVYMEVGRRAGLDVQGVGLPGHFIVRISTPEGDLLVDPFHEGAVVSEADCQSRLDRIYGGRVKVEPHMLAPCRHKGILARMLRNLKAIYVKSGDHDRALRTVDLLVRLDPRAADEIRDRGLLHAALDCYARAAADFEAYLEQAPGAPEAPELRQKIAEMRRKASRLN